MAKRWCGPLTVLAALSFGCGGSGGGPTDAVEVEGMPAGVAGLWVDQDDEDVWQLKADGTFSDYDDEDGVWQLSGGGISLMYGEECVCSEFDLTGVLIGDNELELDDYQGGHWTLSRSE